VIFSETVEKGTAFERFYIKIFVFDFFQFKHFH
jgi:hypothetical protein